LENGELLEKIKDLTAQNEFYKLKNSVKSTDRKMKAEGEQLADFILAYKSARTTKSEDILLKRISDLE